MTDPAYFISAWELLEREQKEKDKVQEHLKKYKKEVNKNMVNTTNKDIWEVAMANGNKLTALNDKIDNLADVLSGDFNLLSKDIKNLSGQLKLLVDASKKPSVGSSTPTPEAQPVAKTPAKKGGFVESLMEKALQYGGVVNVSEKQMAIVNKIKAEGKDHRLDEITFSLWQPREGS